MADTRGAAFVIMGWLVLLAALGLQPPMAAAQADDADSEMLLLRDGTRLRGQVVAEDSLLLLVLVDLGAAPGGADARLQGLVPVDRLAVRRRVRLRTGEAQTGADLSGDRTVVGTVKVVAGELRLVSGGVLNGETTDPPSAVHAAETLVTDPQGLARLQLLSGAVVEMAPATSLSLASGALDLTTMVLQRGQVTLVRRADQEVARVLAGRTVVELRAGELQVGRQPGSDSGEGDVTWVRVTRGVAMLRIAGWPHEPAVSCVLSAGEGVHLMGLERRRMALEVPPAAKRAIRLLGVDGIYAIQPGERRLVPPGARAVTLPVDSRVVSGSIPVRDRDHVGRLTRALLGRVALVRRVAGRVEVRGRSADSWFAMRPRQPGVSLVYAGDHLRLVGGAQLELGLSEGVSARLRGPAQLTMGAPSNAAAPLWLERGELSLEVRSDRRSDEPLRVEVAGLGSVVLDAGRATVWRAPLGAGWRGGISTVACAGLTAGATWIPAASLTRSLDEESRAFALRVEEGTARLRFRHLELAVRGGVELSFEAIGDRVVRLLAPGGQSLTLRLPAGAATQHQVEVGVAGGDFSGQRSGPAELIARSGNQSVTVLPGSAVELLLGR